MRGVLAGRVPARGVSTPTTGVCGEHEENTQNYMEKAIGPLDDDSSRTLPLFPLDLEGSLALTQQTALSEFGTTDLWGDGEP